jgi:hypothetical protein
MRIIFQTKPPKKMGPQQKDKDINSLAIDNGKSS